MSGEVPLFVSEQTNDDQAKDVKRAEPKTLQERANKALFEIYNIRGSDGSLTSTITSRTSHTRISITRDSDREKNPSHLIVKDTNTESGMVTVYTATRHGLEGIRRYNENTPHLYEKVNLGLLLGSPEEKEEMRVVQLERLAARIDGLIHPHSHHMPVKQLLPHEK